MNNCENEYLGSKIHAYEKIKLELDRYKEALDECKKQRELWKEAYSNCPGTSILTIESKLLQQDLKLKEILNWDDK